jgi:uncharacterized protein YcbK (DUF882 family)
MPSAPARLLLGAATLLVGLALSPARASSQLPSGRAAAVEITLAAAPRAARSAAWADGLAPVEVSSALTGERAPLRLYAPDGQLDAEARTRFEQLAAGQGDAHALSPRLEQLVFKAAYHFGAAPVVIVSGWRDHAGRHTAGEALDFKLLGVRAATLAAWARDLPRAGVGIYTHRRTQYVHVDVRETSYHWLDASPPGVTWKERQLRDPGQVKRDASWTPESDLPSGSAGN